MCPRRSSPPQGQCLPPFFHGRRGGGGVSGVVGVVAGAYGFATGIRNGVHYGEEELDGEKEQSRREGETSDESYADTDRFFDLDVEILT